MMKKIFLTVFVAMFMIQVSVDARGENPFLRRLRGTDGNSLIVLMYHRLSCNENEIGDFCISPDEFEKDIRLLCEKGYTFYTATEIAELKKEERGERQAVAITFDDGYESDYIYALPILQKYNAKATFFVFGDAIGKQDYMSEKQLYELAQSPNVEIGNHGFSIHNNAVFQVKNMYASGKDDLTIVNDFMKNNSLLEKITKKKITSLSYPNGIYNNNVDAVLKSHGIKLSLSTEERIEKIPLSQRIIGRFNRGKNTDISKYLTD